MWFTQNKTDGDNAEKVGLKDHLVEDFHVGAGGAVAGSEELFANNSCVQQGGDFVQRCAGATLFCVCFFARTVTCHWLIGVVRWLMGW